MNCANACSPILRPARTSSAGPARGSPRALSWCRAGPRVWRARRRATCSARAPPRHHLARAHQLLPSPPTLPPTQIYGATSPLRDPSQCVRFLGSSGAWQKQVKEARAGDEAGEGDGHAEKRVLKKRSEAKAKGGESCNKHSCRREGPPRTSSAGPARGSPRAFSWCRTGPRVWRRARPRARGSAKEPGVLGLTRAALAPPSPALTPPLPAHLSSTFDRPASPSTGAAGSYAAQGFAPPASRVNNIASDAARIGLSVRAFGGTQKEARRKAVGKTNEQLKALAEAREEA